MLARTPNGTLQTATALPNTPVFAGVVLRQQLLALELDGQGAALAMTSTNAVRCVLGRF